MSYEYRRTYRMLWIIGLLVFSLGVALNHYFPARTHHKQEVKKQKASKAKKKKIQVKQKKKERKKVIIKKVVKATTPFPNAEIVRLEDSKPNNDGEFKRITIVKSNFKYPLVRIEQKLKQDMEVGREIIMDEKTMVADHVVVKLKNGRSETDLEDIVMKYDGYIKRKMTLPGYYIVGFDGTAIDAVHQKIEEFLAESEVITNSEPDYIVSPGRNNQ